MPEKMGAHNKKFNIRHANSVEKNSSQETALPADCYKFPKELKSWLDCQN